VFERENGVRRRGGQSTLCCKTPTRKATCRAFPVWLQAIHAGAHGNADLSAHFFLRGYDLLRAGGALGFVATKHDSPGRHAREWAAFTAGERCHKYPGHSSLRWPGAAAVLSVWWCT